MRISDKIKGLFGQARKYCSEEELQEGADGLAFTVSLLPIPGVQQVGQVVDRILSSRAIKKQFDEVWERINQINADIEIKTDDLEKLQTAALTVQHNSELSHQLEQLLKDIITDFNKNAGTEWIM